MSSPDGPPFSGGGSSAAGANDTDETDRFDFDGPGDVVGKDDRPMRAPWQDSIDIAVNNGGCLEVRRAEDDNDEGSWDSGGEEGAPESGTSAGGTDDDLSFDFAYAPTIT